MDISDWAVFARAAELSSLSAAGRDLRMSAAVVSNRIAKLEKHLGVRLLNRTTRRVSLTAEGALFYKHCIRILSEIEQVETAVAARLDQPRGALTVTAPAGFGRKHLAPFIPLFAELYPDVQVRLHLSDRLTDLVQESIDLAIRIADLKNMSFIARTLAPNKRFLVASPDYLEKYGRPVSPQDLVQHNCLLLRFPGSQQYQWTLDGPDGQTTYSVSGSMDSDNGETLTAWCLSGNGIALKDQWEVADSLSRRELEVVLPRWHPPAHAIYAVYPGGRLLPPRVRVFIDFFAKAYK
ncbi:MAG: LysR family transcriptional regulator, partial [Kiloniellales bacterium]|nr:LysR family transcriptional regulator [Kiloniellales bacterium]